MVQPASKRLVTEASVGAAVATQITTPGSAAATALNATYALKGEVGTSGYDVILLAGQSNMSGRGTPYSVTTDPGVPIVFQYKGKTPNKGTIIPAMEPLDMVDTPSGIGPGMQFARWYVANGLNQGRKVLLVPTAQGGTPLTRVATPTWKPSVAGSLYANAITQANGALASETGSKIVAILWLQGETDGDLAATGAAYQADLDALITGFRAGITGATNVPVIMGQMVPDYLATGTRQQINNVQAATVTRLTNVAFVPSPAGATYHLGDGNHFNAAGQRKIAEDMFTAYRRVSTGLPAAFPYIIPVGTTAGITVAPAQAYSLRLVNDAYSGSAVRVRRSTDNTEQNIGFVGTALDTAALTAFVGAGDGFVTTWYDQSGNARNISQATATAQPKIVAAGSVILSGGKPAVTFDGADDVLFNTTPALYAAGALTMQAVLAGTAPTGGKRWWAESISTVSGNQYSLFTPDKTGSAAAAPLVTGSIGAQSATVNVSGTGLPFDGTLFQASATDSGTSMAQWLNGATDLAATTYARPTSNNVDRFALGGVLRSGSLAPLPMTFSEALFFPSVLTVGNRQTVEANQKAFYGTP